MTSLPSINPKPMTRAAALWRSGHDTVAIAEFMDLPEHAVCRLLAMWRDAQPRKSPAPKPHQDRRTVSA